MPDQLDQVSLPIRRVYYTLLMRRDFPSSATDFCLFAPPTPGAVGDMERVSVSYCTKSGRGARTIPNGTLKGVHFVKTAEYVQITGVGDFTKMNIPKGDSGGELDNRGADGKGNPSA